MIPENEVGKLIVNKRCPKCDVDGKFELIYYVDKGGFKCWNCGHWFEMWKVYKRDVSAIDLDMSCTEEDCFGYRITLIDGRHAFCRSCHTVSHLKLEKTTKHDDCE